MLMQQCPGHKLQTATFQSQIRLYYELKSCKTVNSSSYSEPMTSQALGKLADSRRMQQRLCYSKSSVRQPVRPPVCDVQVCFFTQVGILRK